jgi:hypothetical protein
LHRQQASIICATRADEAARVIEATTTPRESVNGTAINRSSIF